MNENCSLVTCQGQNSFQGQRSSYRPIVTRYGIEHIEQKSTSLNILVLFNSFF